MGKRASAAFCFEEAQRHDPDRFLCAMFAPEPGRSAILALLALNQELGRIAELTSQPLTGLIRLQWWREAIGEAGEGRPRAHPVVQELAASGLPASGLIRLVDAREAEVEGLTPSDLAAFESRARATAGQLQRLSAEALGAADEAVLGAAEDIGTAWGMVGLVRATRYLAARGRRALPPGDDRTVTAAAMDRVDALLGKPRPRFGKAHAAALLAFPTRDYRRAIAEVGHDPAAAASLERRPLLAARLLWRNLVGG